MSIAVCFIELSHSLLNGSTSVACTRFVNGRIVNGTEHLSCAVPISPSRGERGRGKEKTRDQYCTTRFQGAEGIQ